MAYACAGPRLGQGQRGITITVIPPPERKCFAALNEQTPPQLCLMGLLTYLFVLTFAAIAAYVVYPSASTNELVAVHSIVNAMVHRLPLDASLDLSPLFDGPAPWPGTVSKIVGGKRSGTTPYPLYWKSTGVNEVEQVIRENAGSRRVNLGQC